MFEPLRIAQTDPDRMPAISRIRVRNLGAAILATAIQDYRSRNPEAHTGAAAFLYPYTEQGFTHLAWVFSLVEGFSPAFLREQLDIKRGRWDMERIKR